MYNFVMRVLLNVHVSVISSEMMLLRRQLQLRKLKKKYPNKYCHIIWRKKSTMYVNCFDQKSSFLLKLNDISNLYIYAFKI